MEWLLFILFGFIVGIVAKLLHPGRDPGGFIITTAIGVAGSVLGAAVARAIGWYEPGRMTGGFVLSVVGAIVLLVIYSAIVGRRGPRYA